MLVAATINVFKKYKQKSNKNCNWLFKEDIVLGTHPHGRADQVDVGADVSSVDVGGTRRRRVQTCQDGPGAGQNMQPWYTFGILFSCFSSNAKSFCSSKKVVCKHGLSWPWVGLFLLPVTLFSLHHWLLSSNVLLKISGNEQSLIYL